ncbi:hypothetical protein F511_11659 [Dorcoceras hygrometricum]|uniref:Transmembrane protein n=1 Tax=Dorcoceras hygrometricum TaxID=472368 RepID=A0A2Z7A2E3_9LAMI|nr:hypothetical protein F511_11659 [Dorcoceras hygrometricum]
MVSSEIDSMKSELLVESVIKSGLIGDDWYYIASGSYIATDLLFLATGLLVLATGFYCDWFIVACDWFACDWFTIVSDWFACDWFTVACDWFLLRLMFKGRKFSDFRIYGKDNRRSKLEGRAADERVGCPFILGESSPEKMGGGVLTSSGVLVFIEGLRFRDVHFVFAIFVVFDLIQICIEIRYNKDEFK